MASDENTYKVRLISVASFMSTSSSREQVIFEATPKFSESREAEYAPITPVHMPGSIQVYRNTKSRTFSIGARLISRTSEEATKNMRSLQILRKWMLPYFGSTSTLSYDSQQTRNSAKTNQIRANQATGTDDTRVLTNDEAMELRQAQMQTGTEMLGAPPDVLYLYAYSTSKNDGTSAGRPAVYGVNINRIPVVMTSLNITYPDDVDYLPTLADGEPFPIKMDVDITLVETHSPREYERFDLLKYKSGVLVNF